MDYWEDYYQNHNELNTPWEGVKSKFFLNLWDTYHLPQSGKILDIGCGRGSKSIYFAQKGFEVLGVDISESAIKDAVKSSEHLSNKPHFFVGDISKLDTLTQIKSLEFDIVLDKLTSQFLDDEQKLIYAQSLDKHLKAGSFVILQIFGKPEEGESSNIPDWIKKIYKSRSEIENTYGKFLKIKDCLKNIAPDGIITDTYILEK